MRRFDGNPYSKLRFTCFYQLPFSLISVSIRVQSIESDNVWPEGNVVLKRGCQRGTRIHTPCARIPREKRSALIRMRATFPSIRRRVFHAERLSSSLKRIIVNCKRVASREKGPGNFSQPRCFVDASLP